MQFVSASRRATARLVAVVAAVLLALVASVLVAPGAQALSDTGDGGVFVPTAGRVLDTANNIGYSTPMAAGTWRTVKIAGFAGVPTDGSAGAVSVVATVADTPGQGQLTGRPNAQTASTMMTVYAGGGLGTTSNSAIIAVDSDGTIQVQTETKARLILDVQGYYTSSKSGTTAGGFVSLPGARIADTRSGQGIPKAQLKSGGTVDLQVSGTAGVPKGASAVVVNFVAINTTSINGFLTPYATGATRPQTSLNYGSGNVPTSVTAQVPLSTDGKMTVYNQSSTADLVIDVQGYFTAGGKAGAMFTPAAGRAYDTRTSGNTMVGNGETRTIQLTGNGGIPTSNSGLTSVVITLTALHAANSQGDAEVWADGAARPGTTAINTTANSIRSNTITVPVSAAGKISLYNRGDPTHYVIDVQGWYATPLAPNVWCPNPYSSGSWTATMPTDEVKCTILTAPATSSTSTLTIAVDGDLADTVDLKASGSTVQYALVAPVAGLHSISATVKTEPNDPGRTTKYSFGLGDWVKAGLVLGLQDNELVSLSPTLSVESTNGDSFTSGTQFRYLISTDSSMSASIYDSDWGPGPIDVAQGILKPNTTYYWSAQARGTSGGRSVTETATSATQSFSTTTEDPVARAETQCAANVDAVVRTSEYAAANPQAGDMYYACNLDMTQVITVPTTDSANASNDSGNPQTAAAATVDDGTSFIFNASTSEIANVTGLSDDDAAAAANEMTPPSDGSSPPPGMSAANSNFLGSNSPYRTINSEFKETLGAKMVYGVKDRKGRVLSQATLKNTIVMELGSLRKIKVTYIWTNLNNRLVAPEIAPSIFQQGKSSYFESHLFGSGKGINFVFRTSYSESANYYIDPGKKYHLEPLGLRINDLAYGHQFIYAPALVIGHRFECLKTKYCRFPKGKEASP